MKTMSWRLRKFRDGSSHAEAYAPVTCQQQMNQAFSFVGPILANPARSELTYKEIAALACDCAQALWDEGMSRGWVEDVPAPTLSEDERTVK